MRYLISLCLLVLVGSGWTMAQVAPQVICGDGFSDKDCRVSAGILQETIGQLPVSVPNWRWIVVPVENWQKVTTSFGVKPTVPAFSDLAIRSTYVKANLVTLGYSVDENLRSYSSRAGMGRLRWVIAHESGHIVCNTTDDKKAEAAAGRIEFGNSNVCQ